MIKKIVRFSIPEYREKKPLYELLGYKETNYREYGTHAYVTFEVDETYKHYRELAKIEKSLNVKGPIFLPIILFVVIAFVLLSIFVLRIGQSIKNGEDFDLVGNALGFLIPAFTFMLADVVYTYLYFQINRRLIARGKPTIEEIKFRVEEIKNSK